MFFVHNLSQCRDTPLRPKPSPRALIVALLTPLGRFDRQARLHLICAVFVRLGVDLALLALVEFRVKPFLFAGEKFRYLHRYFQEFDGSSSIHARPHRFHHKPADS
jgi:hypothetical protein